MRYSFIPIAGLCLLLSGCGFVGEPLPPLANIPARVNDLVAVQRGGKLIAQFAVPQLTTEGSAIRKDTTLDLRAGPWPGDFNASAWAKAAVHFEPAEVANGRARYEFPAAMWAGQEVIVAVRVIGANGKDAGWSNYYVLPVIPAPPMPSNVRATAVAAGVHLEWEAAGNHFRILRREKDGPYARVADSDRPEWTDSGAEFGKQYGYLVLSIVAAGTHEAESDIPPEVTITPVDTFPPAVPAGLRTSVSPVSIELAWEANSEPDVAGYRIYRAAGSGEFVQVGEVTLVPNYSDRKVEHGQTYRYAVSAFDTSRNESARSEAASAVYP